MKPSSRPFLISAIGTPLTSDERLDPDGLAAHLEEHAAAGIDGLLVAGSMGAMPLLTEATFRELVAESVRNWRGRGELLVGVGDTSFQRTLDRIRMVQDLAIDGVVVLVPYFLSCRDLQLIDYFQSLADAAPVPLYVYDLPQRTGVALSYDVVAKLSEHPGIAGIKCSGDLELMLHFYQGLSRSDFRIIPAKPLLLDLLWRIGIHDSLDGLYAIFPRLSMAIADACGSDDHLKAKELLALLRSCANKIGAYGVYPAMSVLLNARGIRGNFAPRPFDRIDQAAAEELLSDPAIRKATDCEGLTT